MSGSNEQYRKAAVEMARGFGYELIGSSTGAGSRRRAGSGHLVFQNENGHRIGAPSTPRTNEVALLRFNKRLLKGQSVAANVGNQFLEWLFDDLGITERQENVPIRVGQKIGEFVDEKKIRIGTSAVFSQIKGDPRLTRTKSNGPKAPFYTVDPNPNGATAATPKAEPTEKIEKLEVRVCGAKSATGVTCELEPRHQGAHRGGPDDLHWYTDTTKRRVPMCENVNPRNGRTCTLEVGHTGPHVNAGIKWGPGQPVPSGEEDPRDEHAEQLDQERGDIPAVAAAAQVAPALTGDLVTQIASLVDRANRTDEAEAKLDLVLEVVSDLSAALATASEQLAHLNATVIRSLEELRS